MNTTHQKFSKEHNIIKKVITEGGKIALKWYNNKPMCNPRDAMLANF